MPELNEKIVRRLDALLGLALTRKWAEVSPSLPENVRYLRTLGFPNSEIAAILNKSIHHIEVEASKLAKKGQIKRIKGGK